MSSRILASHEIYSVPPDYRVLSTDSNELLGVEGKDVRDDVELVRVQGLANQVDNVQGGRLERLNEHLVRVRLGEKYPPIL